MTKFFESEIGAYDGEKQGFQNVKFKKNDFQSSAASEKGTILEFIPVHYPNPPVIQFLAYITSLNERYDVKHASEQPFGRTNPYYIWQGNDRSISLGFDLPSSGIASGLDNLNNLSWLLGSLYPTYKDSTTATSVAASPLFRVRYANLICSSTNDGQGLLCVIGNVNVTHDVDKGFIHVSPKNLGTSFANAAGKVIAAAGMESHVSEGKNFLVPKVMKLSLDLKVVHDHALGWDFHTGQFRGGRSAPSFPHDFGLVRDASDSPSPGASLVSGGGVDITPDTAAANAAKATTNQIMGEYNEGAAGTPGGGAGGAGESAREG